MLTIGDVMNRTVFALRSDESVATAMAYFAALQISCAPVIDDRQRPIGVVSWRNLLSRAAKESVAGAMVSPARCVGGHLSVRDAGLELDRHGLHHLVVVDEAGTLAGFASAIDVLRGILGRPTPHPPLFPQFHNGQRLPWSSDGELSAASVVAVDTGAGFVAILGRENDTSAPEMLLFEATPNMQERLLQAVARSTSMPRAVREFPDEQTLIFRVAPFSSPASLVEPGDDSLASFIRASGAGAFVVEESR